MWLEITNFIINIGTLILIGISIYLLFSQIKKTHEWNRRKETQMLLMDSAIGKLRELREDIESRFDVNIYETRENYTDIYNRLSTEEEKKEFENLIKHILNYYESISLGIKHNIYDEKICFEYLSIHMVKWYKFCLPFINACRFRHPAIYVEMEYYVNKWKPLLEEWGMMLRKPGSPKL